MGQDGQVVLDHVNDVISEIDVQPGEDDVPRALRSLNRSQDLLEMRLSLIPPIRSNLGTHENITTSANGERTASPTGFLTVERLQFINPDTSLPSYDLGPIPWVGGSSVSRGDPILSLSVGTGPPRDYTLFGGFVYWSPLPDAVHTVRVWGFKAAVDIAVGTNWDYDDELIWPVAAVAARIFKMRADDDPAEIVSFATETFGAVLAQMVRRWSDGPAYFRHTEIHTV